jgi:hypothetical protein
LTSKHHLAALNIASPGSRDNGRLALASGDGGLPAEIAKKLATELCGDERLLAELLMGGFLGLEQAKAKTIDKLAAHCGVAIEAGHEAAEGEPGAIGVSTPDDNARQAIGEVLWPIFFDCARRGIVAPKASDGALQRELKRFLSEGASPSARMLLREGFEGSLLSACLLMGAWSSARLLLDAGADPGDLCAGGRGEFPPLYFALRQGSPDAGKLAADMIGKGADPWGSAPKDFAFEDDAGFIPGGRGALVHWMIFHNHADALRSTLVGQDSSKPWAATLSKEVGKMHWSAHDAARVISAIERLEVAGEMDASSASVAKVAIRRL